LDVNKASSPCKSRMQPTNNELHNNISNHKQIFPNSCKLMMQEPNELLQNQKNLSSLSFSSKKIKNTRRAEIEAFSYHYHDYSTVKPFTGKIQKSSGKFPKKLHQIISEPNFENIITWLPNGRAFRINDTKNFLRIVFPASNINYSSFLRQLWNWGFQRITHNQYYHEMFLRGMPHLCDAIKRLRKEDLKQRSKEEKSFALKEFHRLSTMYPALKDRKFNKSSDNIPTTPFGTFERNQKTDVTLENKIERSNETNKTFRNNTNTNNIPRSKMTEAELTAIVAMKQLSAIISS